MGVCKKNFNSYYGYIMLSMRQNLSFNAFDLWWVYVFCAYFFNFKHTKILLFFHFGLNINTFSWLIRAIMNNEVFSKKACSLLL